MTIPAARITLDGQDITTQLLPSPFGIPLEGGGHVISGGKLGDGPLLSLTVTDNEGHKSDSCEVEVDNRETLAAPKKGSEIKVWLGYADTGLVYMGSYKVSQWTKSGRPLKMTVSGQAADLNGDLKSPKSRSYHKKKVKEIVEQVAGKHKLKAKVHPDIGSIELGHIDQSTESDINFITRLAKRFGGVAKIADGNLIINKPGSGTLPSGSPAPTFTLRETPQTDWSATGSERGHYKSVQAAWQDTEKGERQWVSEGEGKPRFRDRKLYKTEDEAKKAAKAQLDGAQRGKVTVEITREGFPDIFSGAQVSLSDFDPDVDGEYTVKTVTHTLDDDGFKTKLSLESKGGEDGDDDENASPGRTASKSKDT